MRNLKNKILYCLEESPNTRNSDISLMIAVWLVYHKDKIKLIDGKPAILLNDLYDLPREDDVKRVRAKIQNEENKFLPTLPEIRKQRRIKEEQWRIYLGYNPELRTE